jgi:hypothetical protein
MGAPSFWPGPSWGSDLDFYQALDVIETLQRQMLVYVERNRTEGQRSYWLDKIHAMNDAINRLKPREIPEAFTNGYFMACFLQARRNARFPPR